jgi:hypothetical protein
LSGSGPRRTYFRRTGKLLRLKEAQQYQPQAKDKNRRKNKPQSSNRVKRCNKDTDKGSLGEKNIRLKKLTGTIVFVAGTVSYFFFVITVALARLPGTAMGTQLLFYLISTLIWLFFAGLLVRWMLRAPQNRAA